MPTIRTRTRVRAEVEAPRLPRPSLASRCRRKRSLLDELRTVSDPSYRVALHAEVDALADVPTLSHQELARL